MNLNHSITRNRWAHPVLCEKNTRQLSRRCRSNPLYQKIITSTSLRFRLRSVYPVDVSPSRRNFIARSQSFAEAELDQAEYYVSLIRIPKEIEQAVLVDGDHEQRSRSFVLLSKEPLPDIQIGLDKIPEEVFLLSESNRRVKLSSVNRKTMDDFRKTDLYEWLFSAWQGVYYQSQFWADSVFLPCLYSENGEYEIVWDVVKMYVSPQAEEMFSRFKQLVKGMDTQGEHPDEELLEVVAQLRGFGEVDFGPGDVNNSWSDVKKFLKYCCLEKEEEKRGIYTYLETINTLDNHRLQGKNIQSILPSDEDLLSETHSAEQSLKVKIDFEWRFVPMSGPWLSFFYYVPVYIRSAVVFVDASRIRRFFELDKELTTSELFKITPLEMNSVDDTAKWSALGTHLLRLIVLLDRTRESDSFAANNSKEISNSVFMDIRSVEVASKLMASEQMGEMLLSSLIVVTLQEFVKSAKTKKDVYNFGGFDEKETEKHRRQIQREVTEKQLLRVGERFKAVLGFCYLQSGMHTVWRMCVKVGLIKKEYSEHLSKCIESWEADDTLVNSVVQSWEKKKSFNDPFSKVVTNLKGRALSHAFSQIFEGLGHTFFQEHRLGWALVHPSVYGQLVTFQSKLPLYYWMSVLGLSYISVFCQLYCIKNKTEWSQTTINRLMSDKTKLDACFDIACKLNVHSVAVFNNYPIKNAIEKFESDGDLESFRGNKSAYKAFTTIVCALVGALAVDLGFSVKAVYESLEKFFVPEIEKTNDAPGNLFDFVYRYVPKKIEASGFENQTLLKNEYFPVLMKYVRKNEEESFFGFYILTKTELPDLDDLLVTNFSDYDTVKAKFEKREQQQVSIDPKLHEQLVQFQLEVFEPTFPPRNKKMVIGEPVKKYFIAPAIRSDTREWEIDWTLIQHVTNKTVPQQLHNFVSNIRESDQSVLQAIIDLDKSFQFSSSNQNFSEVSPIDVLGKVLFLTKNNEVICLNRVESLSKKTAKAISLNGSIINESCMLEFVFRVNETSISLTKHIEVNSLDIENGTMKLLPYTFSYFRCLYSLPFALDMFEQKLLAEDYRETVKLPSSLSNAELLMGLTTPSELKYFEYGHLELLGTAVILFLKTLEIVVTNPDKNVGSLAAIKSDLVRTTKKISPEKDYSNLLGHIIYYPFMPYRGSAPWYPPGVDPFVFGSANENNDEYTKQEDDGNMDVVEIVGDRKASYLGQKVSKAVADKTFKVIAAICFLNHGIEAACEYLISVGILNLEKYPSQIHLVGEDEDQFLNDEKVLEKRFVQYERLQKAMGYQFKDISNLAQAFMHITVFKRKNNEILEFLGDAVLELAVVHYLHKKYPDTSVGEHVVMKTRIICNSSLAWISSSPPLNLPSHLMHGIGGFNEEIKVNKKSKIEGFTSRTVTKNCSDTLEALAGAIFVDSGYSFEITNKVMLRLMKEILENLEAFGVPLPSEMTPAESDSKVAQ